VSGNIRGKVDRAAITPSRAVSRLGDADRRAVYPRDRGEAGNVGPAVGVKHEPLFLRAVPDHGGIGRTVEHRVAESGFAAIRPGRAKAAGAGLGPRANEMANTSIRRGAKYGHVFRTMRGQPGAAMADRAVLFGARAEAPRAERFSLHGESSSPRVVMNPDQLFDHCHFVIEDRTEFEAGPAVAGVGAVAPPDTSRRRRRPGTPSGRRTATRCGPTGINSSTGAATCRLGQVDEMENRTTRLA